MYFCRRNENFGHSACRTVCYPISSPVIIKIRIKVICLVRCPILVPGRIVRITTIRYRGKRVLRVRSPITVAIYFEIDLRPWAKDATAFSIVIVAQNVPNITAHADAALLAEGEPPARGIKSNPNPGILVEFKPTTSVMSSDNKGLVSASVMI